VRGLRRWHDLDVVRSDPVPLDAGHADLDRPKLEQGRDSFERLARGARVEQGSEEHVSGETADTVEVEQPAHGPPPAARARRAAIVPAPNPSSMSTTASPAAHEQSIARSAVSPPRAEP
jgi:hypothetical protein